jgi:type IX secretion system PorP/SprF family membrane protein
MTHMFTNGGCLLTHKSMKVLIKKILLLIGLLAPVMLLGQDAHFSQFYEAPLLLNPARAGLVDGTFQLSGVYRSQWKEVTIPFKTISGTANVNVPAGKNKNNIFGIAVTTFADKAGDASYTTSHTEGTLAYHRNFGSNFNHYLGGGMSIGYASTTFDLTQLTFDEDFMSGTNTEIIGNNKGNYFDAALGFEYNLLSDSTQFNVGLAVFHLTQPTLSYTNNATSVIYRKWVLNAGYSFPLSDKLNLMPRLAGFLQGPSQEAIIGADMKITLTESSTTHYAVYAGAYYRIGDAFIPKLRIDMGDLSFSLSYDFTTSKLGQVSSSAGGPELSLIYIGRIKGISAGRIYNPRF